MLALLKSAAAFMVTKPKGIERLEAALMQVEQRPAPITDHFDPAGIYMREMFLAAGDVALGHEHKSAHFNIVLSGEVEVVAGDGGVKRMKAGDVFWSHAGVRKAVHAITDIRWLTIHATKETDPARLEAELITKSAAHLEFESRMKLRTATPAPLTAWPTPH